ncbi:prostaglandin reductase 1-like [Biomphalaria glabrata]|uniref:15-oxoprostaglandin 13-reductase n=2 Tax=Biomphalaria TaxID=6525 RepID=A0A9W3A8V2_BIOGL|nr:prostaglandin reductase 1-like [Biomphalaria glabrata]KAI8733232.1 prostaglandin reductase 1 isoform X1 [Biomphalaria glabrata]KAK0064185.1 prostaglandin reductase 1 isoform X1 [Biomphalaria pfeifferi]
MVKAKRWIQIKPFEGPASLDNFKLIEEELPALKDGEILIEALYLTVDPYMRVFPKRVDDTPIGQQVARVTESKNAAYPVGKLVLAMVGWRDKTVLHPDQDNPFYVTRFAPKKTLSQIPDVGDFPSSLYLGILGMPGLTAYFGLLEKCRPKPGDVVVVSAAAGAVGSVVGQIAKIKGCTVIGSAGNQEKIDWLKSLGFDHVFNYKTTTVGQAIKEFAPDGIDCYFDNVGGDYALTVLDSLRPYGRMCCCGQISRYDTTQTGPIKDLIHTIMINELSVSGIMVYSYSENFTSAQQEMANWIKEGKLQYRETLFDGFTKLPEAFLEIFKGSSAGKLIVKA